MSQPKFLSEPTTETSTTYQLFIKKGPKEKSSTFEFLDVSYHSNGNRIEGRFIDNKGNQIDIKNSTDLENVLTKVNQFLDDFDKEILQKISNAAQLKQKARAKYN
jgi:hypothetical protein